MTNVLSEVMEVTAETACACATATSWPEAVLTAVVALVVGVVVLAAIVCNPR